jgi:hypothetical protein
MVKLRNALLSDSGLSLLLHILKSALALLVNWIVLAQFPSVDYVTWAVTSSLLMVATASDLGIGQYTTTRLLHTPREYWHTVLREAVFALLPLSLLGAVFVFIALGAQPAAYKVAMAIGIGLRILTIPSGALLNAINQFKLRKAIETAMYVFAATAIAAMAVTQAPILWALLALNIAFLAGAIITVVVGRRHLMLANNIHTTDYQQPIRSLYRASIPYMFNNLTGLLTYGGLIWLCSFFLDTEALARLSVLHTFILINSYQIYDVFLKARQADMVNAKHVARMGQVNSGVMLLTPVLILLIGPTVLGWFAPRQIFSSLELALFAAFLSLEFGFLYLQSVIQVNPAKAVELGWCAWVKFTAQALAIGLYGFAQSEHEGLFGLLSSLIVMTVIGYAICLKLAGRIFSNASVGN